jgi:hypothetical protein
MYNDEAGDFSNFDFILNERAFNSLEEIFCTLLPQLFVGDLKRQKEILKAHFHLT